jgi:hypothetical protein
MLIHHTIAQLRALHLHGVARALEEQLAQSAAAALPFEERFALLVQREIAERDTRRLWHALSRPHA